MRIINKLNWPKNRESVQHKKIVDLNQKKMLKRIIIIPGGLVVHLFVYCYTLRLRVAVVPLQPPAGNDGELFTNSISFSSVSKISSNIYPLRQLSNFIIHNFFFYFFLSFSFFLFVYFFFLFAFVFFFPFFFIRYFST